MLTRLEFDHQAETLLAEQGLHAGHACRPTGERVFLRSTGNLSTGGTATDVTDVVHPDNVEMAVRAVKAIGLDVGGVDFLTTDITESYKEVGGAICEVNAAPGFRMHMAPSEGTPRDVARPGDGHAVPAGHARAGSRSPRSPAPTARPRPRACWRTSTSSPGTTSASPPPTASTSTASARWRAT